MCRLALLVFRMFQCSRVQKGRKRNLGRIFGKPFNGNEVQCSEGSAALVLFIAREDTPDCNETPLVQGIAFLRPNPLSGLDLIRFISSDWLANRRENAARMIFRAVHPLIPTLPR